jgi:glutamate carboxypeptidase
MDSAATLDAASGLVEPLLDDLGAIVNIDSGTYSPPGVAAVADYLQPRLEALDCRVERVPGREVGPHIVARLRGNGSTRVLLIGHMDTVFPDGETQHRPFTVSDGRAYGPGVLDMKSGLLVGLYALQLLQEAGEVPFAELTFILNSDEEIGSPESHDLIVALARNADAALVLEPATELDLLKIARKGVGVFTLAVTGRAAHAGVEPERGRNAILELAQQVVALQALNGTQEGLTVNVGVVSGGERRNVVPDHASAQIDVRVATPAQVRYVEAAFARITAQRTVPDTTAAITGHFAHQPFQQSERSKALFALAREEGAALGLSLRGESTGGGSDGNSTAALGVPTLDGLGPAGDLSHNPGEYVAIDSIAPRIALLAGLLRRLGN